MVFLDPERSWAWLLVNLYTEELAFKNQGRLRVGTDFSQTTHASDIEHDPRNSISRRHCKTVVCSIEMELKYYAQAWNGL